MALKLAGSATLTLASGLHDYNSAYTAYGWFMLNDLNNSGYLYFATRTNNAEGHDGLWYDASDDQINLEVKVPTGGGTYVTNIKIPTGALSAGVWYPWAFIRQSATDVVGWVNGTATSVQTGALGGRSAMQRLQYGDLQGFGLTGLNISTDVISTSDIATACNDALKQVAGRTYHAAWPALISGDYATRWGSSGGTLTATGTITTIHQPSALPNYLFLPSSGNFTTFTPAFDAEWEDTEDADRITGTLTRGSTAFTNKTGDEAVTTNNIDVLVRQYVYGPFTKAGTWDGRIIGSIRCQEGAAAANAQAQMIVRIMSPGGTVRGTVVAAQTGTSNEFSTSLRSILFPKGAAAANGAAVSGSVAYQGGDYLIVEIGFSYVETASTNRIITMNFGEDSSTFLDFSELDTGADTPWILPSFPLDLAMGSVSTNVSGSGSPSTSLSGSASGTGLESFIGSGAPSKTLSVSASGSGVEVFVGTGAPATSLSVSASGSGVEVFVGSGSPASGLSASVSGTGQVDNPPTNVDGSGSPSVSLSASASGSGVEVFIGSGAPSKTLSVSASGSGVEVFVGSGAPSKSLSASASGSGTLIPNVTGSGAPAVALSVQGSGSGTVIMNVTGSGSPVVTLSVSASGTGIHGDGTRRRATGWRRFLIDPKAAQESVDVVEEEEDEEELEALPLPDLGPVPEARDTDRTPPVRLPKRKLEAAVEIVDDEDEIDFIINVVMDLD